MILCHLICRLITIIVFVVLLTFTINHFIKVKNDSSKLGKMISSHEAKNKIITPMKKRAATDYDMNINQDFITSKLYRENSNRNGRNIFIQNSLLKDQVLSDFDKIGNEKLFNHVSKIPDSMKKRILVTGGAGFVGKFLTT